MDSEKGRMRLQLVKLIEDWNANRLDLFALSQPNEDLEFHGVMRFYFQEAGQKVATKCIRVSSTATTRAVIDALIEKFHPDLRMLSMGQYSLWEVHENGEERQLRMDEKPLLVQLNWHKDDREGRFLLRRDNADNKQTSLKNVDAAQTDVKNMKRKLSRREKKEQKKKEKRAIREAEDIGNGTAKLYAEVPPTTFTRTISNPEIVMKKRRERKLAEKLKNIGDGGSLKIYGEEVSGGAKPYVTLLVSLHDRANRILKEALEKYGIDYQRFGSDYYLAEVRSPLGDDDEEVVGEDDLEHRPGQPQTERALDDDDCPLLIYAHDTNRANITFHVRRKTPAVAREVEARRKSRSSMNAADLQPQIVNPSLIELNPDGSQSSRTHIIHANVMEVGNDRNLAAPCGLPLYGPYMLPRHCVLAFVDGVVTVTPCSPSADVAVDEKLITETTILYPGQTVRIGQTNLFRFLDGDSSGNRPQNPRPPAQILHRTPSEQGMVRSVSTPMRLTPSPVAHSVQRPADGQHYDRPPVPTQPPPAVPSQQQFASHHRRTPPVGSPTHGAPRHAVYTGRDAVPAIIELLDEAEDDFLSSVLRGTKVDRIHFKLAPAYVFYMCCRYRASPHYRTGISREERGRRMAEFLAKLVNRLHVTIQDNCHEATPLAFWMANCSELLNFVKLDTDLNPCTNPEPQESMFDAVQKAYDHLVAYFKQELHSVMPPMLDLSLDDHSSTSPCVHMLSGAMSILRHCRVNAALTIQIFSQLFHYVNMYLFNWLVSREGSAYCTRHWGMALRRRLADVQAWSEKQGLEAAAECRLERVLQASQLLQMPKNMENLNVLCASITKLNSLQIRSILERYRPEAGEEPVERSFIENLVKVNEEQVDDALRLDGQTVQLEEEVDLQLPFLLPDDGYSPQVVRGIPNGLREFVEILLQRGICRMILQPTSSGSWIVHMTGNAGSQVGGYQSPTFPPVRSGSVSSSNAAIGPPSRQNGPEIAHIRFQKGDGGIGLSIIQAQGVGQTQSGIYVKNVVPGSSAARDGRLEAGDQLLKVNGESLVGISQEMAAKVMGASGPTVHFEVAKLAVLHHGLSTVIYQQSPDVSRRGLAPRSPGQSVSGRVRSVEHLSHQHHHSPQMAPQSGYPNPMAQPRQPDHQHPYHQRYPSSSSVQHGHYQQQQPHPHPNTTKTGPPPVQYHIHHQYKAPVNNSHARSMSASNLKDDPTTPTEIRRQLLQQQQQQQHQQQQQQQQQHQQHQPPYLPPRQNGDSPTRTPVFPPAGGQVTIPQWHQDRQEEQYYQNLAHYQAQQQQQRSAPVVGSVARRMSASDYSGPLNSGIPPQRQQSAGALGPSCVVNQQYHRLPSVGSEGHEQRPDLAVHRASSNTDYGIISGACNQAFLASAATANGPNSCYHHPPVHSYHNGRIAQPAYQNLPNHGSGNTISSQVPWNRPGTPTINEGMVSPPPVPHQHHARLPSYQQEPPTEQMNHSMRKDPSSIPDPTRPSVANRTKSTDFYDQRYPTPTLDVNTNLGSVSGQEKQPVQRRLGQEAAAVAAGRKWMSVEEEREIQIQAEVERLMREEVERLETKDMLNEDEQRRYRALKFELEYRRRVHSLTNEEPPQAEMVEATPSMVKAEKEFDQVVRSLEPMQNEAAERMLHWRNSPERRDEAETENPLKRQQVRDQYYEEAEQRFREEAMRERHLKEGRHEQAHVDSEHHATKQRDEDKTSDLARMYVDELQAKLQGMNVATEPEIKPRSNGIPSTTPARIPEVPPKRKVVFNEIPEVGTVRGATPTYMQRSPTPVFDEGPPEHYPPPPPPPPTATKYVYDQAEDQQPRAQVIGAQEVYRDPRQERLKNLQHRKQPAETEKLSFKDKMRLFAAEIGESSPPKDRIKSSSAQRELESTRNGSGSVMNG